MSAQAEVRPRGRPRSEPSRQAVLAATIGLLGEVGFDALSMQGIAARAGVSKATIYRWWGSKVEVVVEAVDAVAVEVLREPDTGSLEGDLRAVLSSLVAVVASPLGRVAEALSFAALRDPALHEALDQHFMAHRREVVTRILSRARERGEVREDVDDYLIADMVVGLLFNRVRAQPSSVDARLVESVIAVLADGVRSRA
jgi:AcrR family transcriptional regulator